MSLGKCNEPANATEKQGYSANFKFRMKFLAHAQTFDRGGEASEVAGVGGKMRDPGNEVVLRLANVAMLNGQCHAIWQLYKKPESVVES